MLGSNDTVASQRQWRIAPLVPDYKKAYYTPCQSHQRVHLYLSSPVSAGSPAPKLRSMASVRRFAVAALIAASFLAAAVGAQPMDPKNPFMSDPNVIPVYPPTYVTCYNDTHGQQGSEPKCNVLALQCPHTCRDTCYVHCLLQAHLSV